MSFNCRFKYWGGGGGGWLFLLFSLNIVGSFLFQFDYLYDE